MAGKGRPGERLGDSWLLPVPLRHLEQIGDHVHVRVLDGVDLMRSNDD
jgi:hypothetical protein